MNVNVNVNVVGKWTPPCKLSSLPSKSHPTPTPVQNPPPTLEGNFTKPFKEFVAACLNKEPQNVSPTRGEEREDEEGVRNLNISKFNIFVNPPFPYSRLLFFFARLPFCVIGILIYHTL